MQYLKHPEDLRLKHGYNYLYSKEELKPWVDKVKAIATETAVVRGVSVAVVLAIGVSSNWLLKKQFDSNKEQYKEQSKFNQEQHQVHGLLQAFWLLNDTQHREWRRTVFVTFFKFRKERKVEIFNEVREVGNVMAGFDVIGRLVKSNNISLVPVLLLQYCH